jgi:hypothetical protein
LRNTNGNVKIGDAEVLRPFDTPLAEASDMRSPADSTGYRSD